MSKNKLIDVLGAALIIVSLFLTWFGPINGLKMIEGAIKYGSFSTAWPFYVLALAIVGALLLLIGSLVDSAGSLAGTGYFLAVSCFLIFIIKLLIDSKGKIFQGSDAGFYAFLAGGLLLLLRPVFRSR